MKIEQIIKDEYIHARNNDDHAHNASVKIQQEIVDMWRDIAYYTIKCGLRGEGFERFAEYGYRRIGGKPFEDEYIRLKEVR